MQKAQRINWEKNLKVQVCFQKKILKISDISKFSILSYSQNRKLGIIGKRSFTSNFDNNFNLRCKNDKKLTETKT